MVVFAPDMNRIYLALGMMVLAIAVALTTGGGVLVAIGVGVLIVIAAGVVVSEIR